MANTVTIYALVDPRDPFRVRYVGKSVDPSKRLAQHINDRNRHKSHKNDWVKALLRESVKPIVVGIHQCSADEWEKWERFWIAHFKSFGLVNSTDGGEIVCDMTGYKHSAETRAKISAAGKGRKMPPRIGSSFGGKHHTEATKAKLSAQRKGKPFPALGLKRAIEANTGKKRSPETCAKIGAIHRGKIVPEHVTRMFFVPVRCIETGEVFESVKAASLITGIGRTSITQTLCKVSKTAGGYHWERISGG